MEANLNITGFDGFGSVSVPPTVRAQAVNGWNNTLVGILLTKKFWPVKAVDGCVKKGWSLRTNVETIQVVPGRYLFKFRYKDLLDRVPSGGPWTMHGVILLLQRWDLTINPEALTIPRQAFWVKLLNLDYEHMNHPMMKLIAGKIDQVLRIDPPEKNSLINKEVNVRVMVKIVGPLMQGIQINLIHGGVHRVGFLYMNRPEVYCTRSFRLDHKVSEYKEKINHRQGEERIGTDDLQGNPLRFQALATGGIPIGNQEKITRDFLTGQGSTSAVVLPTVFVQKQYCAQDT